MAYELTFDYVPCEGFIYRFDARCKWLAFLAISSSILKLHFFGIFVISIMVIGLCLSHPERLKKSLIIPRSWAVLFFVVFVVKILKSPPTMDNFLNATLVIWKMVLWITLAILMSASTKPSDTLMSINYFLRFLPLKWNHRITMMITLTIRFIPMFLKEFEKIQIAYRARLGNRKTLTGYFRYVLLPLMRSTFKQTDSVAVAIWARGYREDHPLQLKPIPISNILALIVILAFVIFLMAVDNWYFYRLFHF